MNTAVYGAPPRDLFEVPPGAVQVSPLVPGSTALEGFGEGSLASLVMAAPPGTLERRHQLACALRALCTGAELIALAPKDKGGSRLRTELQHFGCAVEETARRHHRICVCRRPDLIVNIEPAVGDGGLRFIEAIALWSQPGVFSWDRIDPGSALLSRTLPTLSGRGADLGCGVGYLARGVLSSTWVERLTLIDIDRRAVEAARRNIGDARADFSWADVTEPGAEGVGAAGPPGGLDFIVTNPPFHDGGLEDRELGVAFIRCAAKALRKGGVLWLVANRHLPYEGELGALFAQVRVRAAEGGYKVLEARR